MNVRENPAMKALAFIAAVAAFAAAAIMGWYQLVNYDALWNPNYSAADGYSIYYLERADASSIQTLLQLTEIRQAGIQLSLYQEQELARLEEALSADHTNLRWQLLDENRTVLQGNTEQALPTRAQGLFWTDYESWDLVGAASSVTTGEPWDLLAATAVNITDATHVVYADDWQGTLLQYWVRYQEDTAVSGTEDPASTGSVVQDWSLDGVDLDTVFLARDNTTELLRVTRAEETYLYGPCLRWVLETNQFGWQYDIGNLEWIRTDTQTQVLDLVLWLDGSFPVEDEYEAAYASLDQWKGNRELLLGLTVLCAVAGVLLTAYLCAAAGHRRGRGGISLNWFHRLPGDLLLALLCAGVMLTGAAGWEISLYYAYTDMSMTVQLVFMGVLAAAAAAMLLGGLLTVAARCKAHTLWRNTVIWRLCRGLWRLCEAVLGAVPLIWKVVAAGIGYLLFTIFTFNYYGMFWLLGTGLCVALLCLWAYQWKKIRTGARQIIGGGPEHQIDTRHMLPDLRQHADELNNLGQAISAAVEDRMRSERFRAELITNVSHDLKTPLTSIINYVDLLKKEDISNPKAAEYLEVLDRKSQRLKKLTEDLVEASKASTGSLTVALEPLDLSQLAQQALAEYEDRLEAKGLTVVRALPEHPVWVVADGRHLWRVMDNLLGNCAKYALEGTRIYLAVQEYTESAAFSIKNISRDELNIPPERLMERFVRGDESRTTEGSGLGLSIAQSLTDLQHGRFEISIDGDLFKATVTLPRAEAPEEKPAPETP